MYMVVRKKKIDCKVEIISLQECSFSGAWCTFGFHELTELKDLTGLMWVMFHLLKHLKVSFAITVCDTEGLQVVCFVFMSPIQKCIQCFLAAFEHFWQEFSPASFSQNPVWVKVNFSLHSDVFLFWCTLFYLYSVRRKGSIIDMHWKCPHKAVKNCIFKTSIKYMVYAVNCTQYVAQYLCSYLYFQSKAQTKITEIEKDSLIYILQSCMSSVLLSFTFLCFAAFRTETLFVVTSCQG